MQPLVLALGFLPCCAMLAPQRVSAAGTNDPPSTDALIPGLEGLAPGPGLVETQVLQDERLEDVTSIVISRDGRHAYAAAFNPGSVSILDRHPDSGVLRLRDNLSGDHLNAAVAFRLSPDETNGAASCFRANSLVLYGRNPDTGDLEELDVAGGPGKLRASLNFCIDNVFSPDGKHLYSVSRSAIGVFRIENDRLIEGKMAEEAPVVANP